jgi:DNA-directed RNA polymerase subunit RPC12/RpoP
MIKVLNKKVEEPKIYRQMCDGCKAELECEYEDTYEGVLGARYVKCPECGSEVMFEEIECKTLTFKNIEFPKHFFEPGGVDISNDEIQGWIRNCLKIAEESKEPYGYFVQQGTGNAMVVLLVYEDEYEFVVTKDYYSATIPKANCE